MTDDTPIVPAEQPEGQPLTSGQPQASAKEKYYVRFTLAQRYLHVVLFSSFLGLAATGLPMRFSDNVSARFFARIVGGFGAILFFHKFCAVVLTLAFLYHLKDIAARADRERLMIRDVAVLPDDAAQFPANIENQKRSER